MTPLRFGPQTHVLVLTGAGVSQESGVPTFRDANGLWEGHAVEDVASPEGFERNPKLVWRFYSERRLAAKKVHPNPGHFALSALEAKLGERFLLATQNVDGLHRRAGSQRVLAIHGELFESRCVRCAEPFADDAAYLDATLPVCGRCGSPTRPNIVWFGEMLDPAHLEAVGEFIERGGEHLVFIAAGTSGLVYPAAGFVDTANAAGGTSHLVDAAPSREFASRFDHVHVGKSGELLPGLFSVPA